MVLCEQGAHELGNGFPLQSWWTYCCDCATFWPAEFSDGTSPSKECLVCDRVIDKHYLCAMCHVVSVESAAMVRRKSHFIDEKGIKPNCPACQTVVTARLTEHNCSETGLKYLTARATCVFCQQQLGGIATRIECWSCGTELVTPFKFCKRCGQAQEQNSTSSTNTLVTVSIAPSGENKLEAPVADTDPAWFNDEVNDEGGNLLDLASDTPLHNDFSEDTGADEEYESRNQPYLLWQEPAAVVRKRRAPWLFAVISVCVSAGILLPVFALYGDRKKSLEPSVPAPALRPPAGMVYIGGGEFMMGTDDGDEYERPAHKETVASFFMDATEVTSEDYQQFVRATGHRPPPQWSNNSYPAGAAKLPVTGVDWYDADAYARWAKKRLPTEQEWEFAARANDGRRYPWGNNWSQGAANAGDSSAQQIVSVASFPRGKTPSGLMDLAGNAWEWTSSDLVAYPNGSLSDKPAGQIKIVRGGSWQEPTNQITTTYRGYLLASGAGDYSATGFRCVSEVGSDRFSKAN
jgi:formylglycine-generating enzyme required for sulfatase activity/uncharacterized OB-fold protein